MTKEKALELLESGRASKIWVISRYSHNKVWWTLDENGMIWVEGEDRYRSISGIQSHDVFYDHEFYAKMASEQLELFPI